MENHLNENHLRAGIPSKIGWVAVIVLILVLGIWGGFAKISGAVIAQGVVEVETQRQIVEHPTGGIVGKINVKNGDFVEAGEILIELDPEDLISQRIITENQYFERLARIERLIAERDDLSEITFASELFEAAENHDYVAEIMHGQERLFTARLSTFEKEIQQIDERIIQFEEQILGVDAQISAIDVQITLTEEELKTTEELFERGLTQASFILQLKRNIAQFQGQRGALVSSRGQLSSEIARSRIEQLRAINARRELAITEIRDLEAQLNELIEQITSLERTIERLNIKAPVAGIVLGLQVFAVQSVISAAEPLLFIVPQDQPLIIKADIPVTQVDQVFIGQDVSLRFSAFDQRFTPEVKGEVRTVSADAELNESTGARFYISELRPFDEELSKLDGLTIIPGMPVEAYIQTGERTPLNYLTKPLADYFYRAFREE